MFLLAGTDDSNYLNDMLRYLSLICPRNNRAQKDFEASGCFAEVYRMLKCLCVCVRTRVDGKPQD